MAKPLVSILIPCHNAKRFVADAVESALGQTHENVEVVVVDDGSTDKSVEVLRSFGSRITLEAGPNRGACAARNRALTLSRGEFIQFLDADDMLFAEKIERQLPFLLNDQADMVLCMQRIFDENGLLPVKKIRWYHHPPGDLDPFVYFLERPSSTPTPLHRRSCLEGVGGFRAGLPRGQERDLHLRLAASGVRIHFLPEFLVQVRRHDGPRITGNKPKPGEFLMQILELTGELLSGPYQMTDERRAALAGYLFKLSIYSYRHGNPQAADLGFKRAKEIARAFEYPERDWYKHLERWLGPMRVEKLLDLARRAGLRRWLKRLLPA